MIYNAIILFLLNRSDDLLFKDLKSLGLTCLNDSVVNGNNKSVPPPPPPPPNQPPVNAYQELLDIFPLSIGTEFYDFRLDNFVFVNLSFKILLFTPCTLHSPTMT